MLSHERHAILFLVHSAHKDSSTVLQRFFNHAVAVTRLSIRGTYSDCSVLARSRRSPSTKTLRVQCHRVDSGFFFDLAGRVDCKDLLVGRLAHGKLDVSDITDCDCCSQLP